MAHRPLSDFHPRERLASVPHTTRRFACRSAIALSPDGRTLAVVSDQGAGTYEAWTVSAGGGRAQRAVTVPDHAVRSLCWSASGERLAAADGGGTELHQLYVRHPDGPVAAVSVHPAGEVQRLMSWNAASPDGRRVAFSSNARVTTDMDIVVADLDTGSERQLVTGAAWHVAGGWSPNGAHLLVMRVLDNTNQDLLIVDPRTGEARDITRHEDDGVLSADGARAAFARISATEPWQVWTLDIATGEARVALASTFGVPAAELVEPLLLRIPAADGDIPCFVYRPRGARGPVPAVLYPHGGPEGQSRPAFAAHLTHLASIVHRGMALVVPNIHGSTGYGRAWQVAIHKDWGGIDLRDLRAVSDWMTKQPDFDQKRLAVYGGSYGGFATLTCVTRIPKLWRCAVDVFGVANLITMIENAQPNWRRFLARWIGDVERDREKLIERSPITHIESVRCPMLILQGENDPRVPKEESDQVVERLRGLGRRVEYVVYPGEGHGFTNRANAEDAYGRIVDFLTKELVGS